MSKLYALYHGDKFIDIGTRKHLADLLQVKEETISFYMSKAHRKRTNDEQYIVIKIEENEDE